MARKKKPKIRPLIPCQYCLHFQNSKRMIDAGRIRYCPFQGSSGRDVLASEEMGSNCEHFTASPYFWCDKWNQRISILMCVARSDKKESGCRRCKQIAIVKEVKLRLNGQITVGWRKKSETPQISWRRRR